jgi:hypothetical protein
MPVGGKELGPVSTLQPSVGQSRPRPTRGIERIRRATTGPLTWVRALWLGGTLLLIAMVVHLLALAIRGGAVTGPVSLRKPIDFAESGWLMCWAMALILPLVDTRPWQRAVVATTTLLFGIGETTVMAIQAWRGVPSHYNFTTTFDALLVRVGAAGFAGLLLVGLVVLIVATVRTRQLVAAVRVGVLGGVGVLLLGCVVGFGMISNNSGVFQGSFGSGFANRSAGYLGPSALTVGKEYVLFRPATQGGDLVLPHAIAIHGLILLTVPAVLLTRTALSRLRQVQLVAASVAAVVVGLAVLLGYALRQLPLDRLDVPSLIVLGVCVVTLIAVYVVLIREWRTATG